MHALPIVIAAQLAGVARAQENEVPELAEIAEQVVTAITDGEYAQARQRVDGVVQRLESLERPPAPEDLATLWQSLGAIGVYDAEQAALVRPSFDQACAILPGWFNERLGGMARQQWEAGCAEIQPTATLEITSVLEQSAVYIDGRPVSERQLALAPGLHLVQVLTEGQLPYRALLELSEAQHTTVDAGLELEPQPSAARHLSLSLGTGLVLAGAGVLGWLAAYAHRTWQQASQSCSQKLGGCSDDTIARIEALESRRTGLGVATASCGLVTIGLGVSLAITW